jgi:2-amino-4-hydroxy-6-hydroxymethyldihydropteridine diphosphokinase
VGDGKGGQRYLIALGSNVPHHRHGRPELVLRAALKVLTADGIVIERASPILRSAPLGPSRRRYANAAAVIRTGLLPDALLANLQQIEDNFGRRRRGQRWSARVLDLDIVLWSGDAWAEPDLTIPHPEFRGRGFVLVPAAAIAPHWRDPLSHLTIRHLVARLTSARPAPRGARLQGPLAQSVEQLTFNQ